MLERATACLDSGARLSVRCARRASRSNRSLGSTFWHHGAGDLDLSPWATTRATQPPLDVHGNLRGPCEVSKKEQKECADGAVIESPFLDFLYPPQALALLHRHSGCHVERWERRNERRLPKGFIQANRRYSSKAKARHDHAPETENVGNKSPDESHTHVALNGKRNLSSGTGQDMDFSIDNDGVPAQSHTAEHGDEQGDRSNLVSPAELAEHDEYTASLIALRELNSLLASPERLDTNSTMHADYAWSLFEKIGTQDRTHVDLKIKFLDWLSDHSNELAETHCLELFHTIPTTRRTLAVYKSVLPVFIRSNLYGLAEQAHIEALDQLDNGHEISVWLCSTAIKLEMWDLASRVQEQLDAKHRGRSKQWVHDTFWQQIAEAPHLLSKAISLSKHCRMLYQAYAMTPQLEGFSVSLFRVAIVQQYIVHPNKSSKTSKAQKTLDDGRIRYLIGRVQLTNADAPAFLRDVMHALINRDSKAYYPDAHKTVSYMYRQCRSMKHASFRESTLFVLMKRLVEYTDTTNGKREQSWCISPSALERDWLEQYGKMPLYVHHWLLEHHAYKGDAGRVQALHQTLAADYPEFSKHENILWTLVYAHARRGDVKSAKLAFDTVQASATAAGQSLPLRVWNVLLHAHSRADDIDGGLNTMKNLITSGYKPDIHSFHPVLELYASRGDVDSVEDLLEQFDSLADLPRGTELYGSLMVAHFNAGNAMAAQKVLQDLIPKVHSGQVQGTLTKCFNILLARLGLRRKVDDTMQAYNWMKDERVKPDNMTYAALMQALTAYRQADAAWKILDTAMPEQGLQPRAFHYAIVMTGFVRQRDYKTALEIHRKMLRRSIEPTVTTNAIYLKAKASYELRQKPRIDGKQPDYPVELIVDELRRIFEDPAAGLAAHEPQSFSPSEHYSPQAFLISQLINVYGAVGTAEAVQTLVKLYGQTEKDKDGVVNKAFPLRILSAIMPAYIQSKNWDEARQCWQLAKEQADELAIHKPVPRLAPDAELQNAPDILKLSMAKTTGAATKSLSTLARAQPEDPAKPAPALRHILSQPLRHHITALAFQARFSEMVSTVASVLSQGYVLDNSTWNIFIEHLVRPSPPLALLAFRLTERYLIPSFPGWIQGKPVANLSQQRQGLQYMRARYLSPDQLMPRYRTLVKLAGALLDIRRTEGLGLKRQDLKEHGTESLYKHIGTMKQIRQHAPRTLYAIQSMPTVEDGLQTRHLGRQYQT